MGSESADGITCIKCRIEKSSDDFYAGQGRTCKACTKLANRRNRAANPIRYRATRKAWEKDNLDRAIQRRKNRLRKRYALSPERLLQMLEDQDFKCLICKVALSNPLEKIQTPDTTKPVVDHDHRDGHVRGLLCSACNTALGLFEDNAKFIKSAYFYLKKDQETRAAQLVMIAEEE